MSFMIDVFNMFVMSETPEDSKAMATKYDRVAVLIRGKTGSSRRGPLV